MSVSVGDIAVPDASPPVSVFVIYDRVAATRIGMVLVERHPAAAVRIFTDLCGDKSTSVGNHPLDYELRHVGFIDDEGALTYVVPRVIVSGEGYLATQRTEN